MKRLIVLTSLSTLFICCHGEEVEMPEDVYRMVSKDKTRWIANARGAKAKERFRVVDDLGNPVSRARIDGQWGTPSSNAATFEGETDTNGVFSVKGVSRDMLMYTVKKDCDLSYSLPAIVLPKDETSRVILMMEKLTG